MSEWEWFPMGNAPRRPMEADKCFRFRKIIGGFDKMMGLIAG